MQRIAVVTGASSGIGRALALELAREGYDLGLTARRAERLERLASEVRATGVRAEYAAADATRRDETHAAIAALGERLGPIDLLVTNAGVGYGTDVLVCRLANALQNIWTAPDCENAHGSSATCRANCVTFLRDATLAPDAEVLEAEFRVNVFGAFYAIEAVIPSMHARGSGHVVAIASLASYRGLPGAAGYCATKAALTRLVEGMRPDWARAGIGATIVHPGYVRSDIPATSAPS